MKGLFVHVLEKGLSKFLSYKRLVEISSKLKGVTRFIGQGEVNE